jgi:hypothetical protein
VDSSGSIRDNNPSDGSYDNWQLVLEFMTQIVNALTIGPDQTRIGVVKFANKGESMFYLNDHDTASEINNAILSISYEGGNTNTSGGLREMTLNQFNFARGDRIGVKNVAVVITDGISTFDSQRTILDAVTAHNQGIEVYSIGVMNIFDEYELSQISSSPHQKGKNYFTSAFFQSLSDIKNTLVEETCSIKISENLFCHETALSGHQCFCTYAKCDVRPLNSTRCEDIDECSVYNGGCQQTCRNIAGSYLCECKEGFTLREDYHSCKDIDECQNNPCFSGQLCTNTYGSYYCLNVGGGSQGLEGGSDSLHQITPITVGTLVGASVLTAVLSVFGALVVVLGIRQLRRRNNTPEAKVTVPSGHLPSPARGVDNFGFNSVASKMSAKSVSESDTASAMSVDMNY